MSKLNITPGNWIVDSIESEGEYGSGEDSNSGFSTYCVTNEDGKVLFDALNRDSSLSEIHEEHGEDSTYAWDNEAKKDLTLAAAAPKLYEALDKLLARYIETLTDAFFNDDVEKARAALKEARGE